MTVNTIILYDGPCDFREFDNLRLGAKGKDVRVLEAVE
jgi:hypothetical protein